MRALSARYRLALWKKLGPDDRAAPPALATDWLRSWLREPGHRHEIAGICDHLGVPIRRSAGWMNERELDRLVRPAIERSIRSGQLVLLERSAPRPLPQLAEPESEPVTPTPTAGDSPAPVKTWIEFEVQDSEGQPLAGVRYEAKLTDDSKRSGVTNDDGLVRFDGIEPGLCEFRLLDFDADELGKIDPTKTGGSGGGAGVGAGGKVEALEILLVDDAGQPLGGQRFIVELTDGSKKDGTTGDDGKGKVANLPAGEYDVSFPDLATGT